MTTVDSQTQLPPNTSDLVLCTTKDNDNAQVGVFQVISEELEAVLDEADLTYFRKGNGSRPVSGRIDPGHASKTRTSSSSTPKTDPRASASKLSPGRGGTIKPTKSSDASSKDRARK